MPVRMWKHRPMIMVCTIQNQWGIWNGFILHIMPSQSGIKVRKEKIRSRYAPREKTTSRTVTVVQ